VSFRWVGDTLRHIGTVIHRMLRRIAGDGVAGWDAARIEQQKPAYRSALLELGVPGGDLADAADRVAEALSRALADERGRWLLGGDHVSAACEYSLTGVDGAEVVSVRIDRTFIDTDGTRWIIDYKSSSHEGAGIESFLDNERERYRDQLERYRRMLGAFEARPVRMGLYFPLLNGWREVEETSRGSGNPAA
jgi:ATP-dependent exoDNAse (exonuclease V) beta subunit